MIGQASITYVLLMVLGGVAFMALAFYAIFKIKEKKERDAGDEDADIKNRSMFFKTLVLGVGLLIAVVVIVIIAVGFSS